MLTLPPGTLPPLPAQYATFNHQTGALIFLFFIYKFLKVRYSLIEIFFIDIFHSTNFSQTNVRL
jgi:hypothetical protein